MSKISDILGDNFEAEPAGYFNFEQAEQAILKLIDEAIIKTKRELFEDDHGAGQADVDDAYNKGLTDGLNEIRKKVGL